MKYPIILFLLYVSTSISMAQPINEPTYWMRLAKAEELKENQDYYNALDMYEECYRETRDDSLVWHIAQLNFELRDFERAEKWFERAIDRDDEVRRPELRLQYGRTLRINGNAQEAFEVLNDYIPIASNDSLSIIAENELIGMENMSKLERPIDLFVTAVPGEVNTGLTDQSPARHPDGSLYYASFNRRSVMTIGADGTLKQRGSDKRKKKKGRNKNRRQRQRGGSDKGADYHFKIYQSKLDKDNEWDKPDDLKSVINREDYHTGNVSFTEDGERMFFTRARIDGDEILESVIYTSTWNGEEWTGAQALTGVNGDWLATHPVAGELFGNEVLFFVSDMPGGYGGMDIFYANAEGGNAYGLPVNLGNVINSWGDEVTPFYREGDLYFSSDAYPGAGGLDIYKATWDGTKWSAPKNMGPGYNSPYDDYGFNFYDRDKKGYLVSNRPYEGKVSAKNETCCDDIFDVEIQEIQIKVIVNVFDEEGNPLETVTGIVKENKRNESVVIERITNAEGNSVDIPLKLDKSFRILVESEGYQQDSFEVNTVGFEQSKTFTQDIVLKPIVPETEIVTINQPIRLNNIYYDLDDDRILPEAEPDLEFLEGLLEEYPNMVIELSSHTDARASNAYNQDLSQRRANNAKRWLVNRGINPNRIRAVGYGETQILNKCVDGVECTEAEHRLNRRTEFKIIEGPRSIEIQKEVKKTNNK